MLDLISRGAQGHGPVHLLLSSAAELGFACDGDERGWVRPSLPLLKMMIGPIQHFTPLFWKLGAIVSWLSWRKGRVSGVSSLRTLRDLHNYLPLPICGKVINCC